MFGQIILLTLKDVLECLLEEFGIIAEGGGHHSCVDIVEFLTPCPFFFDVVDFEATIGWYTGNVRVRHAL